MCQSCEAVTINGVLCHEHGCPDAWKDIPIECKWCGNEFIRKGRWELLCSDDCAMDYNP